MISLEIWFVIRFKEIVKAHLSFDEFEILHGIIYLPSTGRIYGLMKEYEEKAVKQINPDNVVREERTHILQFFLTIGENGEYHNTFFI